MSIISLLVCRTPVSLFSGTQSAVSALACCQKLLQFFPYRCLRSDSTSSLSAVPRMIACSTVMRALSSMTEGNLLFALSLLSPSGLGFRWPIDSISMVSTVGIFPNFTLSRALSEIGDAFQQGTRVSRGFATNAPPNATTTIDLFKVMI